LDDVLTVTATGSLYADSSDRHGDQRAALDLCRRLPVTDVIVVGLRGDRGGSFAGAWLRARRSGRLGSAVIGWRLVLVMTAVAMPACARRIDLGSDLVWSATHETGDLSEWALGLGGSAADTPDATVAVSTDFAHSGRYSVKLGNGAVGDLRTARLWHQGEFPQDAFYSLWYYLPRSYQTKINWTIMQFRSPTDDPSVISQFLDVDIRSLPGGELILTIFDHRPQYLRLPTADPAVIVPVGRWFQIEVFYRNASDSSGRFTLWLDGKLNYDIVDRPMATAKAVYWTPCSTTSDLSPTQSAIYVDDAAISYDLLSPQSTL
jgi:hypothetical protein